MGKLGRSTCICMPYVLTIASLICIIIVGLGCTKASSSTLSDVYFMQFNLQNLSTDASTASNVEKNLNDIGISNASSAEILDIVSELQNASNLKDFYSIGLWGYCEGDVSNHEYKTTFCSTPKPNFYFNPIEIWGLNGTTAENTLPGSYHKVMRAYQALSKWMFVAYTIAFLVTATELVVGIFAICSRWGSCISSLVSVVAFISITAASITTTILFCWLGGSATIFLKQYGVLIAIGKSMFAATWLAVALNFGAVIFWTFSACCCSGHSPRDNQDRISRGIITNKGPYDYQPLNLQHPYRHPPPPLHHEDHIALTDHMK